MAIHNDAYACVYIVNIYIIIINFGIQVNVFELTTPYICTMCGRCFYLQDGCVCATAKMNDNIISLSSC